MSAVKERLLKGETLQLRFSQDVGFDVWVEKFANPPQVFFEGKPLPVDQLEEIVTRVESYLADDETRARWTY